MATNDKIALDYQIIRLITLIRGLLVVGGVWKWFQSISHTRKPYGRHQNFDSRCHRKKVSPSTYEHGGHFGFWPLKRGSVAEKIEPHFFLIF